MARAVVRLNGRAVDDALAKLQAARQRREHGAARAAVAAHPGG
jgi:hypothetical protein